jgi:hypothetical protein
MHQSYDYVFDAKQTKVSRTEKTTTLKEKCAKVIQDVQRYPLRRQATNAIADHALREVYAKQQAEKDAKIAAKAEAKEAKAAEKEAAKQSKLESVVQEAKATA